MTKCALDETEIIITKVTNNGLANRACEFTSGKHGLNVNMEKLYNAEHSPSRTQMFWIEMIQIPTYVSVHFVRHKVGCEHFVQSNRNVAEVIDRDTPINHAMFLNAQSLINLARFRLCRKADPLTRKVMQMIEREMYGIDRELAVNLRANCAYRMGCPEIQPCFEEKGDE